MLEMNICVVLLSVTHKYVKWETQLLYVTMHIILAL